MKLTALLISLALCSNSFAAETVNDEQRQSAEQRAEALMKDLAAKQADLDDEARASIKKLDLLTRKAEAYILVEQPVDAGRMLAEAQELLEQYQDDPRDQLKQALKGYKSRLLNVGQVVLNHTASFDLSTKKKPSVSKPKEPVQSEPAKADATKAPQQNDSSESDLNQNQK